MKKATTSHQSLLYFGWKFFASFVHVIPTHIQPRIIFKFNLNTKKTWSFCQAIILYLSMTCGTCLNAQQKCLIPDILNTDKIMTSIKSIYVILLQLESNILKARSKKKKIIRVPRHQHECNQRKPSDGL